MNDSRAYEAAVRQHCAKLKRELEFLHKLRKLDRDTKRVTKIMHTYILTRSSLAFTLQYQMRVK